LIGFTRVSIPAGATRRVSFTVDPSRLAFHGLDMRHTTEPGTFTFRVGRSAFSSDMTSEQVTLDGDRTDYERRSIIATTATIN